MGLVVEGSMPQRRFSILLTRRNDELQPKKKISSQLGLLPADELHD